MKNFAGIYGDIKGRSFEFLYFYAKRILTKDRITEEKRRELFASLKTSNLQQVIESWNGIVGEEITNDALRYVKEHTPYLYTDDTILMVATMDALLQNPEKPDFKTAYHVWGNDYRESGFGGSFKDWLNKPLVEAVPYNSFGNGSAMRVGPIGNLPGDIDSVRKMARRSAMCTHNNPEGIRGAEAVASAIHLARKGRGKNVIKAYVEENFFYDLERPHVAIREKHKFDASCQVTVPACLISFLEADNLMHAIDLGISLGGDSDTQGMITGSIAEAFYGEVPEPVAKIVWDALPTEMTDTIGLYNNTYMRS